MSFRNLVEDVREHILEWNLPWLLTLKMLTLNPGQVALDYVAGKRTRYLNPVRYMFYTVGLVAVLATMFDGLGGGYFRFFSGTLFDQLHPEQISQVPRAFRFLLDHSALLLLVYSPLVAGFLDAFYSRTGRNYVETACLAFYLIGHVALLMFLMTLAGEVLAAAQTVLWRDALLWFAAFMTLLLYINGASRVFYGRGLVYTFVATLTQFVVLIVLIRGVPVWLIAYFWPPT